MLHHGMTDSRQPSSARPAQLPGAPRFALWELGFRPFFLLAGIFSAGSIALWAVQVAGYLPSVYLRGPAWHGHEMVFGFTMAVMAGFLLTAVRNWSGQPTLSGVPLMALAALWVVGRVLALTPFGHAAAVANVLFPIAVAAAIGVPLLRSRNRRNYFFAGILLCMAGLALLVHLALQGRLKLPPRLGLQLALDVVLFVMVVMGGRVIPMFTNNGVPGAAATRHVWVERLALGSVILLLAADVLHWTPAVVAMLSVAAALVHGTRLFLWRPWRTLAVPLVWILHAAYGWIVVSLVLRGASALGWLPDAPALHALTVGAIGSLTLGMMTRVARGHTARPLVTDGYERTAFILLQMAAVLRVFGVLVLTHGYAACIQLSALLWAAAFGLHTVRYWPVLTRARLDGKPG